LVFGSAAAGLPSLLSKPTQESFRFISRFDGISFVGIILDISPVPDCDISICKGFNSSLVSYPLAAVASAFSVTLSASTLIGICLQGLLSALHPPEHAKKA
jgi:hypothetical protein